MRTEQEANAYQPPPVSAEEIDHSVPNIIQVAEDGSVVPVDYELSDDNREDNLTPPPPSNSEAVL